MTAELTHRRGLAVLLVVALALTGCGGDDRASGPSCERADVDFDEPTTRLTFRVTGANPAHVKQARRILCMRLAAFGVEHRVQPAAGGALTIDVPRSSKLADRPRDATIFGVGRLAIYDWEANVIGPSGKPAPTDPEVTGGRAAGQGAGELDYYEAVLRASKRPADVEADNGREASSFYAIDPTAKKVFGRAASTRAAALDAVPAVDRDAAKVLEVKPGTLVLRGERARDSDDLQGRWYLVLRDDVALRGVDIRNPQQRFAEPRGAGEPVVGFEFTSAGAKAFQELTRTLADRGSRSVGVQPGQSAADANQHFAMVLDDQIVSVPYIDFRQNSEGVDGSTGSQIQGGFTIASARQLASILGSGALPVPLELVANTTP